MPLIKTVCLAALVAFASSASAAPPININAASAEELADAIVGVGIKRAELIVRYREVNGPFKSLEELVNVQGIGERTVDRSRDNLTVDAQ